MTTPRSARSRSGAREPGRGDDVLRLEPQVAAAVGPAQVHGQRPVAALRPARSDRWPHRRARRHRPGRGPRRAGRSARERRPSGPRLHRQLRVRRRHEGQRAGPRQEPVGQLEPGVLLAQDDHPATGIRLGRADLGVVVGEVHAVAGRRVRLGHADGDDHRIGLVDAVARLDDEAAPVSRPGRLPAAVVADRQVRLARERGQVGLHLRARRELGRAVHERRLERPGVGLVRDEAVPVEALVGARSTGWQRVRLGPRQQALEERPAPEHPARRRIRREDGEPKPLASQPVGHLERSGTRADDHDLVGPGRRRALAVRGRCHHPAVGQSLHRFAARSRRACAWSIRNMTLGWAMRKPSTCAPGRTRQRSGRVA